MRAAGYLALLLTCQWDPLEGGCVPSVKVETTISHRGVDPAILRPTLDNSRRILCFTRDTIVIGLGAVHLPAKIFPSHHQDFVSHVVEAVAIFCSPGCFGKCQWRKRMP